MVNFTSVGIFIEQPDEEYLVRNGLDPDGALYKMYNQLDSTTSGERPVGKKTRLYEGTEDLQELIDGISINRSVSERHTYLFDNVDVAAVVNYLAINVIIQNNDLPHKNYYLYSRYQWHRTLEFYTMGYGFIFWLGRRNT